MSECLKQTGVCYCADCEEKQARENERRFETKKVADTVMDYLNRGGKPKELAQALACSHRTLQQEFQGVVGEWITLNAKLEAGWFDLRNQATVELCKKLFESEAFQKSYLPYI